MRIRSIRGLLDRFSGKWTELNQFLRTHGMRQTFAMFTMSESQEPKLESTPKAPTPLINRAKVKQRALSLAKDTGRRRFTRVSHQFVTDCQVHLDAYIRQRVHAAPSIGKTL